MFSKVVRVVMSVAFHLPSYSSDLECFFSKQGQNDLFTRFRLLNEEGKELTDKTLRDTLLNFLIAGRDSSGLTMSWFIYMMTLHPHIEEKLFEELRNLDTENVVNGDIDSNEEPQTGDDQFNERVKRFSELLTFDALLKLQYLHACILETLRLYPVVPLVILPPCNS